MKTMIWETYPWKQDLNRKKRQLLKYNTQEYLLQNEDKAYTIIEKAIFYSAFIIRKLVDCKGKTSDEVDNYSLKVFTIKPRKEITQTCIWPKEGSHDWDNERKGTIKGVKLCNSLIHSFIFSVVYDENGVIDSFVVSSDYDKNKVLYRVPLSEWIKYIDFVVSDDIVRLVSHYDIKTKDFEYTRKERGQ